MAVRFLPPPEAPRPERAAERGDLAEVIELRSRLAQRSWLPASEGPEPGGAASGAPARGAPELGGAEPDVDPGEVPGAEPGELPSIARAPVAIDEPATEAPSERAGCAEDGVRILARRARSSGELREELLRLEHDAGEVETVIDEFIASHYLDDSGLARAVTEKLRSSKRASRSQIRVKLRGRKLPDAVIEEALGALDVDEEFALLRETAVDRARKLGGLDRQTAERRLLGFLARRGWSGEPAARAAREALDGAGRPSGGVRFS
ncbi:recombination regulator RecX [Leucobacter allii]|uniref:Regulatory protein RecX n=1 Tax=Leucobacter allii TaxID=2932247 RepID=A0ABY4FPL9_9MICO|nr:regulatory protein RecX [Leucobacter allii]UOQ58233.1 recombination regulator RecX [Leucobacter allii]